MSLTLKHNGVDQTPAAWGLEKLQVRFITQSTDTLTFKHHADYDAAPIFAHGDIIELFQNGHRRFFGRITQTPRRGAPAAESHQYIVKGPGWWLGNLVYQQVWRRWNTTSWITELRSRALLGTNINGPGDTVTQIDTRQTILDVLNYAISHGTPLQLGTILDGVGISAPSEEVEDLTCMEVIQRILRWHPAAISWIEYSTTPHPTIHIQERQELPESQLEVEDVEESIELNPREDLLVPGVHIRYEIVDSTDGEERISVINDIAPAGLSTPDFQVPIHTIEMAGTSRTTTVQRIVSTNIDPSSLAWWQDHVPWMAEEQYDDFDLLDSGAELRAEDGTLLSTSSWDELIEGSIASWMPSSVETHNATLTMDVIFNVYDTSKNPQLLMQSNQTETLTLQLRVTNASKSVYRTSNITQSAEPVPGGVANRIYQQLSVLQYDGRIVFVSEEAALIAANNRQWSLLGTARPEWSNAKFGITDTTIDIDSGKTTWTIGRQDHLGPRDIVQLLRLNRRRRRKPFSARTGQTDSSETEPGTKHPRRDTTHRQVKPMQTKVSHWDDDTLESELDVSAYVLEIPEGSQLPSGVSAHWRLVDICVNGQPKQAMIFMSTPFDPLQLP